MRQSRTNPLALAVLTCLYERPMHPYEIDQTLRQRTKHESIRLNYGSLYKTVESLARRQLIRVSHTVREGQRPQRTVYEITEAGTEEMHDWLSSLIQSPAKEYLQFEAGLSLLPILSPDEAAALLKRRVAALTRRLAELRVPAPVPRLFLLETEYQERLCAAELEFVRGLVDDIESGRLGGLDLWQAAWQSGRLDVSALEKAFA
jgi:DNA-binding PadR family transcriptional regulator